jgi:hypothetical protein
MVAMNYYLHRLGSTGLTPFLNDNLYSISDRLNLYKQKEYLTSCNYGPSTMYLPYPYQKPVMNRLHNSIHLL